MSYEVRYGLRSWKYWASKAVLIGLVLIVTSCQFRKPEITQIMLLPEQSTYPPNTTISIQVIVEPNGYTITDYAWWMNGDPNGNIEGDGHDPIVTYRTCKHPGSYIVGVAIAYEDGSIIGTTTVVVSDQISVPPPSATDTPTITITPTSRISVPTSTLPPTPTLVRMTETPPITPSLAPATSNPTPTQELPTATEIPTITPTLTTLPPTPTILAKPSPTREFPLVDSLPVINLISPAANSGFSGKNQTIELRWRGDKKLPEGTYYFVDASFTGIDAGGVCRDNWAYFKWTKEEHFVVDPWLYDVMCPDPSRRMVRWNVYVGQPTNGLEEEGIWLSSIAEPWNFRWYISGDGSSSGSSSNGGSGGGGIVVVK